VLFPIWRRNPSATPMVVTDEDEDEGVDTGKKTIDEQVENLRTDGTEKDPTGFLGPIRNNVTGGIMSEVSMGIGPKDNQKLIPLLVPTLTQKEIETLQNMELEGNVDSIPQSIKDKAVRHAQEREEKGLSPFYGGGNLGERPEGAQLELTGDDSFDSVRTADEMLLESLNEGPTKQDAQDFLDREQEMLNPSRPEFKELTREEEKQQSQEQRARDKKERDDRIDRDKKEREYRLSPEGKEEIKIARKEREKEILEEYGLTPEKLYDNLIDPDRHDLTRIQSYVDGTLSKNRKKGSTKGTVGKTLAKYGLENMTRPEIKEWLKENSDSLLARR